MSSTNKQKNTILDGEDQTKKNNGSKTKVIASDLNKSPVKNQPVSKQVGDSLSSAVKKERASKPVQKELPKKMQPLADNKIAKNLMQKPAGSLQSELRIFQIYYESWQRELLDPIFASLDNSKSTSELLEFDVFSRLSNSEFIKGAKHWGALSWRFTEKTGMTGQDLVRVILANPGRDVYFCNPVPENEALYHNLWVQGETSHPQFIEMVKAVFLASGLPVDDINGIDPIESASAANYFVGTPKFWNAYLPWVQNILKLANKNLEPSVRDLLHSSAADDRGLHGGATYIPFIVERLFPIFIKSHAKDIKAFKVALPERDRELNVHLRLLREMKEMAFRTKSAWLAACWVNYRNLYLTQTKGKDWCQKYLSSITPKEIIFN